MHGQVNFFIKTCFNILKSDFNLHDIKQRKKNLATGAASSAISVLNQTPTPVQFVSSGFNTSLAITNELTAESVEKTMLFKLLEQCERNRLEIDDLIESYISSRNSQSTNSSASDKADGSLTTQVSRRTEEIRQEASKGIAEI